MALANYSLTSGTRWGSEAEVRADSEPEGDRVGLAGQRGKDGLSVKGAEPACAARWGRMYLDLGFTLDAEIDSRCPADRHGEGELIKLQKKPEYLYDLGAVKVSLIGHKRHYPGRKRFIN